MELVVNEREPLEEGKEYILFLSGDYSMSGELSIISGDNGMVDLSEIDSNSEYLDIKMKSVIEYESNLNSEDKEKLLKDSFVRDGREIVAKRSKEAFQIRYKKGNKAEIKRTSIN